MRWEQRIDGLAGAIDALAGVDVAGLSPQDQSAFLFALNRQLRRLDWCRHRCTGVFERSGALREVGYRSLAQWHRDRLHCSTGEAGRVGALARALVHMPTVAGRWAAGELGAEQARCIARLRNGRTEERFDEDEADLAEATGRLGRDPEVCELARTARQRRHDAMVEIAVRARAHTNTTVGTPGPLVTVICGPDALAGGLAELWDHTPLSPQELARVLRQDPTIQRFLYGSESQPIAYNPRARLYTGKLREAILTRDRHCTGRGCLADTRHGAIDHIRPVTEGGRTTPHNGRGTCHPCNRARPNRRFRDDNDPP